MAATSKKRAKKQISKKAVKKVTAEKKAGKKPSTAKKTAKKPTTAKKVAKKATKKRVAAKKTVKKRVAAKKTVKKRVAAKKTVKKRVAAKKTVKKRVAAKKTTKKTAKKPVSRKKATKKVSKKPTASKKGKKKGTKKKTRTKMVSQRRRSAKKGDTIHGIVPYKAGRGEEYMNPQQVDHFLHILSAWRRELVGEINRTIHSMQDETVNHPDPNDRATQETDMSLELRSRDRERKLIKKIDDTVAMIDSGDYGYCVKCGVEVGIARLEARPTANLCIDCKTLDEIREKQMI